ncbi:MAG: ABC transporter permease [Chloroflexota bacterium]|nr:MAG: ABC transporter permease [Chloroflexota bacterium]
MSVDRGRTEGSWWLIMRKELADLWIGGRLLILLVFFSLLMSVTSILRETESQLSLIPPAELVFLTLLSAISFGMLISLIVGADSISGERERATLEPLLLAPIGRRRIVAAKFLAAISPWPVALVISVPYVLVLGQGNAIIGPGLLWTLALGSLLAIAFAGFAMLVSMWSRSNRTSLFVCLLVYLLLLIPTQFPGEAQKGPLGYAIQQVNPMQASSEFLEKFIVNHRAPSERFTYLVADIASAIVVIGLLFLYAAPRLQLEGGSPRIGRPKGQARRGPAAVVTALLVALGLVLAPVTGSASVNAADPPGAATIQMAVDLDASTVKTGDEIEFTTTVTNIADTDTPELTVAMNIINLGKRDPVDPEDWSPERTQVVEPIAPGESAEQSWTVEAIADGNFMVYMTAIVKPGSPDETTLPVTGPGIHLTVTPFQDTNPGGVLPVALGMPIGLIVVAYILRRYWRRNRASGLAAVQGD